MSTLPHLHTANDVAEKFGKSVEWVRRAAGKDLPGVRLGKDWRFTDDDLALFLERRRAGLARSPRQAAARLREGSA